MDRASAYLMKLCERNESKQWPPGLPLTFFQNLASPSALKLPPPPDWLNFAPIPPRTVEITAAPKKVPRKKKESGLEQLCVPKRSADDNADTSAGAVPIVPADAENANIKTRAQKKAKATPKAIGQPDCSESQPDEVAARAKPKAKATSKATSTVTAKCTAYGSAAQAKPKAKAKAKGTAKSKGMAKLGCSKCRYLPNGCAQCRRRISST